MKCQKCGTEYEGTFCSNCGTPNNPQLNSVDLKNKKPFHKKWPFWIIVVFAVIAVTAALGACNSKPQKIEGSNDTSEAVVSDTSTEDIKFYLNDTAVFENIKVTAEELKESMGESFIEPDSGKIFVGVKFTIENISDKDQSISTILLFDAYADDIKCEYSFSASMAFSDGTLDGTISPGKKLVGYYAVEVPSDWTELELQVSPSWLSSSNMAAAFVFNK